jgi:hypothetical protein
VVETGGLENRCTGNRTGGSNPSSSVNSQIVKGTEEETESHQNYDCAGIVPVLDFLGVVDGLCHPRRGPIAPAVVWCAEVGTTFHYFAWDLDGGCRGIIAPLANPSFWIEAPAARASDLTVLLIPVARPFPDVADHVVKSVAIRCKVSDRRRVFEAVLSQILPGEFALPRVGHVLAVGRKSVTPYELCSR